MSLRELAFKSRGFTPVPFIIAGLIWSKPSWTLVVLGVGVALLGESIRFAGIRHAGSETRTRQVGASMLITTGPFARVRNPLYLGNMLIYLGFALSSGALLPWLPLGAFVFFVVQYSLIIVLEEAKLRELFGAEYEQYCCRVPRLVPRLGRMNSRSNRNYTFAEALRSEKSTLAALTAAWGLLGLRVWLWPLL